MAYPVPSGVAISTPYGARGSWSVGWHTGTDFASSAGTPIYAVRAGTVVSTGTAWGAEYGSHQVVIQDSAGFRALYAHMQGYGPGITGGATVTEGQVIGYMGREGRATGPHLHLEIRRPPYQYPPKGSSPTGNNVDTVPPASYINGSSSTMASGGSANVGASIGQTTNVGSFEETTKIFVDFDKQKSRTKWNPPMPSYVTSRGLPGNTRGFIMRDPMPLYQAAATSDGRSTQPAADDKPSTYADGLNLGTDGPDLYGFRFLMNPPAFSEAFSTTPGIDPVQMQKSQGNGVPTLPTVTGSSLEVELKLSRIDDMFILRQPGWESAYGPTVLSREDREGILTRGTMWDMEYLFRTLNGKPIPVWWNDQDSSDWGSILPRPIVISMGDGATARKIRGFISSVSLSHEKFAPGMIPILTTVRISIERMMDYQNQIVVWTQQDANDTPDPTDPRAVDQPTATSRALMGVIAGAGAAALGPFSMLLPFVGMWGASKNRTSPSSPTPTDGTR